MKKMFIIFAAAFVLFSSLSPAFALLSKDFSVVEGPVMMKKEKTREITVKNGSGNPETYVADEAQWNQAKEGDVVLIFHKKDANTISHMVVTQPKQ